MANRYMKNTCTTSLIIREIITPARMAIIKKIRDNKSWPGCEKKGTLVHRWWECKWVQLLWKQHGGSLKNYK